MGFFPAVVSNLNFRYGDCCVSATEYQPAFPRGSLVFLHGRFGDQRLWSEVIGSLQGQFHCVAIDLPGFGESFCVNDGGADLLECVALVLEVIRKTIPGKAIVIGHDIGGAIAQLCAIQDPGKILGLVLINSSCVSEPLRSVRLGMGGWRAYFEFRALLREALALKSEHEKELSSFWTLGERRHSWVSEIGILQKSWPTPEERRVWREKLADLDQPALILWGSHDSLNSLQQGFELVRLFQESHFYQNERCAHWPCLEDPGWVLTRLRELLFHAFPRRALFQEQAI